MTIASATAMASHARKLPPLHQEDDIRSEQQGLGTGIHNVVPVLLWNKTREHYCVL